ncbi:MAG TPA: hypothetical protein VFY58_12310 [Nocardioides sp.]|nr:hypothetical protein [Nocardioides sp.]
MSRAGWIYLRDSCAEAWETRSRTGDASVDLLIQALRRRTPPAGIPDPYEPGEVIRGLWNRGVEPRHLKRAIYGALPGLFWKATVEPGLAVLGAFRGKPSR